MLIFFTRLLHRPGPNCPGNIRLEKLEPNYTVRISTWILIVTPFISLFTMSCNKKHAVACYSQRLCHVTFVGCGYRYGESHTSKEIINTKQILFTPPLFEYSRHCRRMFSLHTHFPLYRLQSLHRLGWSRRLHRRFNNTLSEQHSIDTNTDAQHRNQ